MALYNEVGECKYQGTKDKTMVIVIRNMMQIVPAARLEHNRWQQGLCASNNAVTYCPFVLGGQA